MRKRKDINKLEQTSIDDVVRILNWIMKCARNKEKNGCNYELSQSVYDRIIKDITDNEEMMDLTDVVAKQQSDHMRKSRNETI